MDTVFASFPDSLGYALAKPQRIPLGTVVANDWSMNKYAAFYRGREIEVEAETSYEAQQKAAVLLKAKKRYEVTVILGEKDGKPVVHVADF